MEKTWWGLPAGSQEDFDAFQGLTRREQRAYILRHLDGGLSYKEIAAKVHWGQYHLRYLVQSPDLYLLDGVEREGYIHHRRTEGATWRQIGSELDISATRVSQIVQRRYYRQLTPLRCAIEAYTLILMRHASPTTASD